MADCHSDWSSPDDRPRHVPLWLQAMLPQLRKYLEAWVADLRAGEPSGPSARGTNPPPPPAALANAAATVVAALLAVEGDDDSSAALLRDTSMRVDLLSDMIGESPCGPATDAAATASMDGDTRRAAYLESKRMYEAERRRRKQEEDARARQAREGQAAAARGPPPRMRTGWRMPPKRIPDLLVLWDFLGSFSQLLWLPPIPLARLDAALCPSDTVAEAVDSASSLVLRDIHCAFLRMVEGRAGKGAPRPGGPIVEATLTNLIPCVGDHHWQVRCRVFWLQAISSCLAYAASHRNGSHQAWLAGMSAPNMHTVHH
jgi:hypothetical protein